VNWLRSQVEKPRSFHDEYDLVQEMSIVGDDIRGDYILSFRPTSPTRGLHTVTVQVGSTDGPCESTGTEELLAGLGDAQSLPACTSVALGCYPSPTCDTARLRHLFARNCAIARIGLSYFTLLLHSQSAISLALGYHSW